MWSQGSWEALTNNLLQLTQGFSACSDAGEAAKAMCVKKKPPAGGSGAAKASKRKTAEPTSS